MDLKLELFADSLSDMIKQHVAMCNISPRKLVDTKSTKILSEVKDVICDDTLDDFYAIDKIVDVFIKHKIETGGRHDF